MAMAKSNPEAENIVDVSLFKKHNVSNEDFLKAVFGQGDWQGAHVCGFREDPYELDALGLRHYWAGGPAWKLLGGFTGDMNQYFAISLFRADPSGRVRRKKDLHEATYCVVLDDVGQVGDSLTTAKVPWDRVKLPPSWILETSPGNYQVGYLLALPDTRPGKVSGLLDALVASGLMSGGKDPGMKGVTRYVRLPEGMNRKAKYSGLPGGGFEHRMVWWSPMNAYGLEQIADAYGVRSEVDACPDELAGAGSYGSAAPAQLGEDVWLGCLSRAGQLKSELSPGIWDIVCPFVDEHTARADSGSAYMGGGRFKCHHGHCENRGSEEFREKILEEFGEEYEEARREVLDAEFGDLGGSRDVFEGMRPGVEEQIQEQQESRVAELKSTVSRGMFTLSDAVNGAAEKNQLWLFKGLFPQQGAGMLFGAPKTGKSFVALDLACRAACGMDWNGMACKRAGMVVYVASEGGRAAAFNRTKAWGQKWGMSSDRMWTYPGTVRMGPGSGDDLDGLIAWVAEQEQNTGEKCVMIVLDTLNKNMVGDENSTEDMTAFVGDVDRMWRTLGCFVLTVHHSGKDATKGARGSTVVLGAVDVELEITRNKDAGLSEPGKITLTNSRHAEDGKSWGFGLEFMKLDVDEDLEDVGSLVVVNAPVPVKKVRLGTRQQGALDVLRDMGGDTEENAVSMQALTKEYRATVDPNFRASDLRKTFNALQNAAIVAERNDFWWIL